MYRDEIIAEVWKHLDSYTEKHHHSLAEIVADLQARQKRSGCRVVDRRGREREYTTSGGEATASTDRS